MVSRNSSACLYHSLSEHLRPLSFFEYATSLEQPLCVWSFASLAACEQAALVNMNVYRSPPIASEAPAGLVAITPDLSLICLVPLMHSLRTYRMNTKRTLLVNWTAHKFVFSGLALMAHSDTPYAKPFSVLFRH